MSEQYFPFLSASLLGKFGDQGKAHAIHVCVRLNRHPLKVDTALAFHQVASATPVNERPSYHTGNA